MGINFRPQVPQETQEYPKWKINESGPSCGYEQYLGPTDNRQYRPIKNGKEEGFIFALRQLVMH
jgi:hypothetical protein